MKIVLLGGSGYVGKGIIQELSSYDDMELVSMSRHGGTEEDKKRWPKVSWKSVDLGRPETWQEEVADADWVVDLIGVLFAKNYNEYYKKTVEPVMSVIKFVEEKVKDTKFLFVSANYAPLGMGAYMKAKLVLEDELKKRLGTRAVFVYPGLIYHKERPFVYVIAIALNNLTKIKPLTRLVERLRPIARARFAVEIRNILLNNNSYLMHRTKR
ncbi:MAG: Fe-S-binding domain-containing protein [Liquorilactobacillus mali]|uniref:Fe-S-binding domain-containing protein n=1 Tax=Liquorilactobacillus mali TaxID=1618 RepID=UPI0039E979BA